MQKMRGALLLVGMIASLLTLTFLVDGAYDCLQMTDPDCSPNWPNVIGTATGAAFVGLACVWALLTKPLDKNSN